VVFTSPDILPPIPWTRDGSETTTVPAPSQASTAASRRPERSPSIISSEAPKRTKSVSERT